MSGLRQSSAQSTENSHISSSSSLHSNNSDGAIVDLDHDELITIKEETAEEVRERCKERLAQGRKTIIKGLVLSDQLDMRNP